MVLAKLRSINLLRTASIILDLVIAAGSFLLAFLTAYGFSNIAYVPGLTEKTVAFTIVCGVCYVLFDVHKGSWRYVSVAELLAVIKATVLSEVVYTVGAFMISRADNVPRSVPLLSALYLIVGLSATRFAYRLLMEGGWTGFGTGMQPKAEGPQRVSGRRLEQRGELHPQHAAQPGGRNRHPRHL